jgi:enamine deaminase RidA (YjgF/YER057c/UK114 family)
MDSNRQNISSGTKWEALAGYSRAVQLGDWIAVSGTTASDENSQVVGIGDPAAQAKYIFAKIERALKAAGSSLTDVIRTRIYVVNTEDWEAVARVHGEIFQEIRPANTLIVVKALVDPQMLVEIEADAKLTNISPQP